MEIIDRYIYAVVSKLPHKQRMDIENELRTLIDDMMEQNIEEDSEVNKATRVLLELGDPNKLADNYLDRKKYLIGPIIFDRYISMLKIVMGAVFLGISISSGLNVFFSNGKSLILFITEYLATLFSALMQAFAWITIIFAIFEYKEFNLNDEKDKDAEWSLKSLPVIPSKKAAIHPVGPIIGILFSTIFMLALYFTPEVFAAYKNQGSGFISIPVFNLDVLAKYNYLLVGLFLLSIGKGILKLLYGKWAIRMVLGYTILEIASLVLFFVLFYDKTVWNPNFSSEIYKVFNFNISYIWNQFVYSFLVIAIIINLIDMASEIYKCFKYN